MDAIFAEYTVYPGQGFTDTDLVEIKQSNHGLGLFAKRDIPKNTRLTSWSGRLLQDSAVLAADDNIQAYAISLRNNTSMKVDGFALRQCVVQGSCDISRVGLGWLANSGPNSCRSEYISQKSYRKLLRTHGFTDDEIANVIQTFGYQIIMLTTNRDIKQGEELTHKYYVRNSSV